MKKLENMALIEGKVESKKETSESQYKGISLIEEVKYQGPTSIKYWM